ncbi:metalloregulator ArsR/SmtB family transcription factor [Actinomycetospora sp. TBRC 11914]|uniref:metalloregulator ArsR/SmtB family transcription factor n=1 Tax=Actinomycetospora sp. TBRC 11914 TaxID=2729387 RepID=UPI00145F41CE|nr:metalloregulator ArsR/SmtB family transcription factor [Actinomycetospora sp. TBRC 11914]NMO94149.1 metalloregulator ArsR/SmtB family transcription factor [Actinomycetospora sp. TBRC 11914]
MDEIQRVLQALGSPVRREILWLLGDGERAAGELAAGVHVSAPTVSEHLKVLRDAGLVTVRVDGTFRRYRARREALAGLRRLLADSGGRWEPAADVPERERASARTATVVIASAELACPRELAFTAFTDPEVYSSWLGVPVSISDGHFSATMEWGTEVRGRYEHVVAPSLVVMAWDFADEQVPVPGGELRAYAHLTGTAGGCLVEVDQLVETPEQARFMQNAWRMVLGRLAEAAPDLAVPGRPAQARSWRPKR